MVFAETKDGMTVLKGRNDNEWVIAPWWPCSGRVIRKVAPDRCGKKWIDEAAAFADEKMHEDD